jgi:hypothetical protein
MKIVFFSLHAAIWVHAAPENRLVRELADAGHQVGYLTCGKALTGHCVSMSAYGYEVAVPTIEKDVVCRICQGYADTLAAGNGAHHERLSAFQHEDDQAEIDAFMATVTPDSYLDLRWHGIDIGRISAYELFLKFKKMSPVLRGEEWTYYRIYIRNALAAALGFRRYLAIHSPEMMFCYSPQYAVNGICAALAIQAGVRVYFIEGSSSNSERYQALRVWDWAAHGLMNPALERWDQAQFRVRSEDAARVVGHFRELFAGTSFAVYSAPLQAAFSARERFGIPTGAKILLATLSSYDEAYAAVVIGKFPEQKLSSDVFQDQFEWMRKTIQYVAGRSDVFLLIRVHPRDFPNKREGVQSEQAAHWQVVFRDLPENVRINWPDQEISLYNILSEADVVLTGWSATGVEALAFGIPVVTYDRKLPSYPADIHLTGTSEAEYVANIEAALKLGRKPEFAVSALHWLAVSFSMGTVRVCEPNWVDRIYARVKAWGWLTDHARDRMEQRWRRFEATRKMSSRRDAALLHRLVATKAADVTGVAVDARKPASLGDIRREIARHLTAIKVSNPPRRDMSSGSTEQ